MKFLRFCIPLIFGMAACNVSSDQSTPSLPELLSNGTWVDLTHTFSSNTIYWPTADNFRKDTVFVGMTENGYYYEAFNLFGAEHGGTHLDAPIHFSEGKQTAHEIPISSLMGPIALVDVSDSASTNRNYQITVDDIVSWETEHGTSVNNHVLLVNTGSSKFWPDPVAYMGTDKKGLVGVLSLSFPGLHPDAAKWLADERDIVAFGLDTPSIDFGQSKLYESHRHLFAANIPGFENVANLDQLPPTGAFVIALPMKIERGSGAPTRIVAWLPN
jgi:kynurenine formamidase